MTAKKTPQSSDFLSLFTENLGLPETLASQTDGMLKAQAELLSGMEEITRDWLQRRREANELAIRAAERIFGSTDPSEMMVAYFDWLGGAMRRLSDDATALSERAFSVTASATKIGASGAAAAASRPKGKTVKTKPARKAHKAKPALRAAPQPAQPGPVAVAVEPKQRLAG